MKLLIPLKGYPFRFGLLMALLMVGLVASATMVPGVLGRPSQDETPPQLSEASVNGTSLTLTFNETLDTASIPDVGDFTISVTDSVTDTQSAAAATSISIDGTTVTLTLDYEVRFADTVTLVYTMGTKPIQDAAGNPASGIGSTDSPYTVDNPTVKKNVWDFTSVTFRSINSDRTYVIAKDDPREFTVENEDEYLDLDVVPVDPRTQLESVRWFRGSSIQYPDISQGDIRIQLPRQGTGTSNFNRAGIRLKTETEELTDWYDFKIFRKLDTTPPSLSTAAINGATLTLTFSETLDQGSIPARTAFEVTVTVPGQTVSSMPEVTGVALGGATVTLSISTTVRRQDRVTLAYTKPQTDPLKDPVNLPVASFTGQDVTNNTPGATDNTLSSLSLSGITLTPAFASATTQYTARVGNDVDQTTVIATPDDSASTVDVSPGDADPDTDGHQVDLMEGANTITATVTPEDTTAAAATYAITVTRDAPPPDTTAPLLVTSSASGATLTMGYDEELDENSIPRSGSFIVAVNGDLRTVSAVAVNVTELSLTLNPAVEYGDVLTLAYAIPTGEDAKPLQNLAGLEAPAIPVSMVDNGTPDPTPPELSRVSATGDTLTLVYDEFLDTESVPAAAAFTVSGSSSTVSAVSVACRTVALTLNSPVAQGDNLTLSYDIPTGENSKPVQNLAGLAAPAIPEGPVTIDSPDTTPPSLMGASVLGDTLTLNFSEDLDEDSVPGYSAFTVTVNEHPRTVSGLSVKCNYVTLTLNPPAQHGDALTLAYTAPTGDGESPIQDLAGLPAPAIAGFSPSNETPDTTSPVLSKTSANQAKLTLTYGEALHEDSGPPITAFTVTVNDNSRTLSSVSVSETDVILTMSSSAEHGDAVTLAYAVPSGDDSSPIRNRAGLPAAAIPNMVVPNDTPDTTPPTLDGASVTGNALTLTYDKDLDTGSKPAATDFIVNVTDSVTLAKPSAAVTDVEVAGKTVTLTLDYQVRFGDTVTLVYTSAANPIQDTSDNDAGNIGTAESPNPVVNSSPKSHDIGVESVTFSSIHSERTYIVPKTSFGQALTVENEDAQLDVSVSPTDTRAQTTSIQWRDRSGDYHSTNISEGDTRVTLPRYGDGQSNYNKVKIEVESESGDATHVHNFNITRKSDTTAPRLTATTVNGATLTLAYDETLDQDSTPESSAFAVTVDSAARTVSAVSVSGFDVVLTLYPPIEHGDTAVLTYTVPTGEGARPIQDLSGVIAPAIRSGSVENQTPDTTPPELSSASVDGVTLTLTFNENLDVTSTPLRDDFNISVTDSVADSQSIAAVTGIVVVDTTVTLTLDYEVRHADTVTVVYIAGKNPIQDTAGNSVTDIGSEQTPHSVDNPTDKSTRIGYASVIFQSINSDRAYKVAEAESSEFTVENADEYLKVEVIHIDRRGRTESIEWFDSSANGFKDDGNMVRLRLQGTGPSNRNRVRISLLSEADSESVPADGKSVPYEFQVTREIDVTPPEFTSATVTGDALVLTYNEALDPGSTPADSDFSVVVVDSATDESSIPSVSVVKVEDSSVILTLDTPAHFQDEVTLTYTKGVHPIRDPIGNPASDFHDREVDNYTLPDTANTLIALYMTGPTRRLTLRPDFDPPYTSYAATVENDIEQTTVTAVTTDPRAKVRITPEDEDRNTVGHQVALDVGDTTIKAVVTPEDINAAAGIYTITVARLPDIIAPTLDTAVVDGRLLVLTYDEPLDENSTPAVGDFTVKVVDLATKGTSSLHVSDVSVHVTRVILTLEPAVQYRDEVTLAYITGSVPNRDMAGNQAEEINNRSITNDTPRSVANTLRALSLRGVTLTPEFSSGVTSYTAAVPSDIDNVVVLASTAGPRATVAISPGDSDTGDGHRARLVPGRNEIMVMVIPEDITASRG